MPGLFAGNVDVAVVRVAAEAMAPAFELPVEFGQQDVGQQWREWTTLCEVNDYAK
jgi:hypothetical protein